MQSDPTRTMTSPEARPSLQFTCKPESPLGPAGPIAVRAGGSPIALRAGGALEALDPGGELCLGHGAVTDFRRSDRVLGDVLGLDLVLLDVLGADRVLLDVLPRASRPGLDTHLLFAQRDGEQSAGDDACASSEAAAGRAATETSATMAGADALGGDATGRQPRIGSRTRHPRSRAARSRLRALDEAVHAVYRAPKKRYVGL